MAWRKFWFALIVLVVPAFSVLAQDDALRAARAKLDSLQELVVQAEQRVNDLRLQAVTNELKSYGIPKSSFEGEVVTHSAMILEYNEDHEQAAWVYHMILPQIKEGRQKRTNDFRPDPKVSTGTAVQEDYFLVKTGEDGEKEYDGFGYDRGHLAPSADFRWSEQAVSESYFYSNMTPQLPEFNREGWVQLENVLRKYVIENERPLLVVTGGVLRNGLPVQERGVNKVSIPEYYYKVIVDPKTNSGVGFVYPHESFVKSPDVYAVTIDSVEALSGINFFTELENEERVESEMDKTTWFPDLEQNVEPIDPTTLPKNTYNSVQARYQVYSNKKVHVCGRVVEAYKTKNGHVFLKFDKAYPEPVFQVFISAENIVNFEYNPEEELANKCLCIKGEVGELGDTPTMFIESDKVVMGCDVLQ